MAQTRPATPAAGVIALILLGGAVATAVAAVMMIALLHQSDVLAEIRHSRGFYVLSCVLVGFFTGIGVMLTRPRGPAAPIAAAVAAIVALYVGNRLGLLVDALPGGLPGGDYFVDLVKYRFDAEDLLAPLLAGAIGGLRVAMVAKSLAPRQPSGQPFPHPAPGGYGHQYQPPAPGQPPIPGQPPPPGQPLGPGQPPPPGQPSAPGPGQPPAPGQPYQPPPGSGQGAAPGSPQGGPPPNDGA